MIGAIVLSWVIAFIPSGILSEMGRELPLTIMVVSRRTCGWTGSAALSALFAMDFLALFNSVSKARRWEQPVATVVFGLLGTVLALVGILNHAETFVTDVGDVVAPFTFILIVDWLWALRDKTNVATYFARPSTFSGQWRWTAMICAGIGFAISFWGNDFLPGFACNDLPLPMVGGVIAAAPYALTLSFAKPPLPVTDTPAAEAATGIIGQGA
jgi:purine-cytosine permease-like protein